MLHFNFSRGGPAHFAKSGCGCEATTFHIFWTLRLLKKCGCSMIDERDRLHSPKASNSDMGYEVNASRYGL